MNQEQKDTVRIQTQLLTYAKLYYYSSDGGTTFSNDETHCTGTEAENDADANCVKIKEAIYSLRGDKLSDHGSDYSIATCAHWCESLDGCVGYLFNKMKPADSTYTAMLEGKVLE